MLRYKKSSGLILALDVSDSKSAVQIVSMTSQYLDAIKIGLPLTLACGFHIIERLKESTNLPIIADFKIADVPAFAQKVTRNSFDAGADAITVHGFAGPTTLEACIDEAKGSKDVIVMTELTHPDAELFMQPVADDIARMAYELGASGIQAPGTRPERIEKVRRIIGDDMLILSCGIGTQGGNVGSAIKAGADFEIVGRRIYLAPNPQKAAESIPKVLRKIGNVNKT